MERDFTLNKYKKLCTAIKNSNYQTISVSDYLKNFDTFKEVPFIIIRHDIDNKVDLPIALEMAEYENSLGIKSSFYFRIVKDVYQKDYIKKIFDFNHEVGYHYEVLEEANGDIKKAIQLFSLHLKDFRSIIPIETVCQHGGQLGEDTASTFFGLVRTAFKIIFRKIKTEIHKSTEIWNHVTFKEFGLLGEAYLSLDFDRILYLSDTSIRWDGYKNRVLDNIDTDYYKNQNVIAKSTVDLIDIIKDGKYPQLNLLVHPANWIDSLLPWMKWHILQVFRNYGKRILIKE